MGAYYQPPQQAQFLCFLWRSSCFRAFLLGCLENLRFDHPREIVYPGVPLILEDAGYHVLVPGLAVFPIGHRLAAKGLDELIVGSALLIGVENQPNHLGLWFLDTHLAHPQHIAEGQLPVFHQRTVLSMVSRSSRPFFRRKQRIVLLSTMIRSTRSEKMASSNSGRNSGMEESASISSLVCSKV